MRWSKKKVTWLIASVLVLAVAGVGTWYAIDWYAKKPYVDVVNHYLAAYKDPDLKTVKSLVSSEIEESLPASQTTFASAVKQSELGQIASWEITKVERNKWIGQSILNVDVTTDKKVFHVVFDVFELPEGRVIRAVSENDDLPEATGDNQNSSSAMMSTGTTSTGSAH